MNEINFKRGYPLHVGSDLTIADKDGSLKPKGKEARFLGQGASGAVYRAIQGKFLQRAVKILAPSAGLLKKFPMEKLVKVFEKEKLRLSQLTHSHITKLIAFGVMPDSTIPYLVMEFVDGVKLHEYVVKLGATRGGESIVVQLLDDALAALQYLHQHGAMHGDVKEANILVRQSDRAEAVLVDLGCAHIFDHPHSDHTYFNSTKSRNPTRWANRVNEVVSLKELYNDRVRIDLYQFGMLLRLLMRIDDRTGEADYVWQADTERELRYHLGDLGMAVLERTADKCLAERYSSADEVRQDIKALLPHYVSPLGIPELSLGSDAVTSISLPDGRVSITPGLRLFVNHPCVQRLHGLNQLDMLRLVYPGATHTRLLHSLEAYDYTRQYVGALLADPSFRAYVSDKHTIDALWIAGLLHDIGHYPLEHVFEDLAGKREITGPYANIPTDEKIAAALLGFGDEYCNEYTAVAAEELCKDARHWLRREIVPLPELIRHFYNDATWQRLGEVLRPASNDLGAHVAHSVIDGPIDVDKVAYLRTDALMTGAQYGRAVDLDSLLGSLSCFLGGNVGGVEFEPSIGIRHKGICAAETIVTARRWMFKRVYWNHSNRAIMAMLRFPIMFLLDRKALTFEEYFARTFSLSDVEAIKWLDERFTQKVHDEDIDIENPAQLLLHGRRGIYKRIIEIGTKETDRRHKLRDYFLKRPCSEWLPLAASIAKIIRAKIPSVKDSDVLLDLPIYDRPSLGDVPVIMSSDVVEKMSDISEEYRNTQRFFSEGSMICRVCVHPSIRKTIMEQGLTKYIEDGICESLNIK